MITIRMPVIRRCPFKDELDAGELAITLPDDAPELHNLAAQVYELCQGEPVTHEQFNRAVLDLLGGDGLVVGRWRTGPWDVTVRDGDDLLPDTEYRTSP